MIIGCCGFGSTGSSAVSDYLMEFEDLCVLDGVEFEWVNCPDGLIDLEYHVNHSHDRTGDSAIAIKRFLDNVKKYESYYYRLGHLDKKLLRDSAYKFIKSITCTEWKGYLDIRPYGFFEQKIKKSLLERRVIPFIEKKKGHRIYCYPMEKYRLSINPHGFYDLAREHIKELLVGLGADFNKKIVLDQPFSGNNPQASFPFYDNPFAIIVDRDPRDNYIFARTRLLGKNHFMAVEPVEDFIKYYRALRDNQPYLMNDDRILRIHFEDMVYNYDETTGKIRRFLDLGNNPNPKSVFDPSLSVNNTQLWKRFPQFLDDTKIIERELGDYLFDFSKYPEPDHSGEMFFGKSPLHK